MPKKIPPALAKFQRRVKAIQRSTGKSFRSAQKQASAENKGKKVSGVRKRTAKKSSSRPKSRSVSRPRSRMGSLQRPENFSTTLADARKAVHAELGWALATQRTARTKKEKKGLQPKINDLTKKLKALRGE